MTKLSRFSVCMLAAALLASPAAAGVGVSVDVLWSPNPDNDLHVGLHASNMAYPLPRERVTPIFQEMDNPYDDYPVLAFVAYTSHVDIRTVWGYRRQGHAWFDVMVHFGVRPSALFVSLPSPPGPPYGKAYGYWKKHRNGLPARYVPDADMRFWVGLRSVSRYTGSPVDAVFEWHKAGNRPERYAGNHYRAKHGKGQGKKQRAGFDDGGGKQKGKGKGHGHQR